MAKPCAGSFGDVVFDSLPVALVGAHVFAVATDRNKRFETLDLRSNAIKYSPLRSDIPVQIQSDGHTVTLTVRDKGPDIPEHERSELSA